MAQTFPLRTRENDRRMPQTEPYNPTGCLISAAFKKQANIVQLSAGSWVSPAAVLSGAEIASCSPAVSPSQDLRREPITFRRKLHDEGASFFQASHRAAVPGVVWNRAPGH